MKSTIRIILVPSMAGVVVGAVLAGWQAQSWDLSLAMFNSAGNTAGINWDTLRPVVGIDETTFNFGTMEHGTTMSHKFRVQNLGTKELHIEVGSTTCKCAVGKLTTSRIAPGAEADVILEWEAKSETGPFRHGATLLTNDPSRSRIVLVLEGTVVESTVLDPERLVFGTVLAGETKQAKLYLMAFFQDEVEILSHHLSDEHLDEQIEVEIEPCEAGELRNPKARAGIRMIVTLHAGRTLGPIQDWLTIEVNFSDSDEEVQDGVRTFNIPIVADVVGHMSIFGPGWIAQRGLLKMGMIESDQGKISRLNIAVRGDHASVTTLKIASVKPKELQANLGERRVLGEQLVHVPLMVEVPAGTRVMTCRGEAFDEVAEIVISTNHPETPELKLQVEFAVYP